MISKFFIRALITAALLCFQSIPNALAQNKGAKSKSTQVKKTDEGVVLNFQNTDVHALINMVSEVTGKNFVVDPRVKAKVTLYSGSELDSEQIYEVFLSVLDVHNLSAVAVGDIIKVVPVAGSKQLPLPTSYNKVQNQKVSDDLVTQVYKLQYASAADILPVIRPLIPAESHVAVHPRSGTLVFTDTEANVKRILGILNHLDVADANFNIHIIPLKHAVASQLKEAISALIGDVVSENKQNGTRGKRATVYAEESTNSIIVNGPEEAYQVISAVVKSLDVERPKTRDLHVVQLKFAKTADVTSILTEVAQRLAPANEGSISSINIQAHEPSNRLIIYANKADYIALKSVIDQIDIRRKQVFIEAIIAEVSFNKSADLGVEWNGNIDSRGGGTVGTDFNDITGGLRLGIVNDLVFNSVGAVVPDLSIVLNALRSDSSTNILSTPNLLTVDNEQAEIVVGQQVPFVTGQFTTGQSSTTTTSTTSVQPFQTIERKDVGLKLSVTPRVNDSGIVTLEVEQEISNVSPVQIQGASDLVTNERRIKATVQAESGKVVVIGGLIRDDVIGSDEKVPGLGDLPIIGSFFKSRSDRVNKTNLMVFLRPRIIDEKGELVKHTREKYDYIRELSRSKKQAQQSLLNYDDVKELPAFDEDRSIDGHSTEAKEHAELVELVWKYALPEQAYKTKEGF